MTEEDLYNLAFDFSIFGAEKKAAGASRDVPCPACGGRVESLSDPYEAYPPPPGILHRVSSRVVVSYDAVPCGCKLTNQWASSYQVEMSRRASGFSPEPVADYSDEERAGLVAYWQGKAAEAGKLATGSGPDDKQLGAYNELIAIDNIMRLVPEFSFLAGGKAKAPRETASPRGPEEFRQGNWPSPEEIRNYSYTVGLLEEAASLANHLRSMSSMARRDTLDYIEKSDKRLADVVKAMLVKLDNGGTLSLVASASPPARPTREEIFGLLDRLRVCTVNNSLHCRDVVRSATGLLDYAAIGRELDDLRADIEAFTSGEREEMAARTVALIRAILDSTIKKPSALTRSLESELAEVVAERRAERERRFHAQFARSKRKIHKTVNKAGN